MLSEHDETWMHLPLKLAEKGRGFVEPNPLVGAAIVREGKVVGEGWHEKFGATHAEINALRQAGEAARGATLYVTLEPCCHHGKTPPCTDAIIKAGIKRVVAAMEDPFPQVAGQGAAILRAAGIDVDVGALTREARRQNAPYLKLLSTGRPYVHAKWAMSLDGKIATKTGDSKWISNEASRRRVHEMRGRMDGILVGIGTALADDPLLTARPPGPRVATRVVMDSEARLLVTSQLVRTAREVPTLVVVTKKADNNSIIVLENAGCEVLKLPTDQEDNPAMGHLLDELGRRRWTNLMVEGGAAIFGSLFDNEFVDEMQIFIAPKIFVNGKSAVMGGGGKVALGNSVWRIDAFEILDGDLFARAIRNDR